MALYLYSIDANALAASTTESVLELSTTSAQRIKIKEWWVEFDGVTATAVPVKVEAGRFTAAVTTATTGTAIKLDPADGTPVTVVKHTVSAEGAGAPETGNITHRIPPTSGYHYIAPLGQELVVAVSSFWRIRVNAAAVVNVTAGVIWEE